MYVISLNFLLVIILFYIYSITTFYQHLTCVSVASEIWTQNVLVGGVHVILVLYSSAVWCKSTEPFFFGFAILVWFQDMSISWWREGGVRKASVLRYKEKKQIRHQFRIVNAHQRPRMKAWLSLIDHIRKFLIC